ncbi:hypothetical protein ACGFJ7_18575 [Actinoplanes sp. NPDC048988]|uniref:hypothetical protein n=1 Tax=Actinoplanes sp. NPDC048988 TaxID=3363901 RepID=UPI003711BB17
MALLLDLANILGGLLLAAALLRQIPRVGGGVGGFADKVACWGWVVGVVALVAGGYYLLVHLFDGPHVFHFEVVGIAVGVALLWDRLTGRKPVEPGAAPFGRGLLLTIFGLVAIVVGLQGLVTPD